MPEESDLAQLKERARANWDSSDYEPLGERLLPAAVALVDACAVSAGQEVLDVAAGNGNAAATAAAEGARVVASDFSETQVERGRRRTQAEGLDVEWVVADAEELPFEDASFDCVLSVFGAQFAPRPERVAAELFRVVRPGGTVGMASWGQHGFQAEMFSVLDRYAPQARGDMPHPREWGEEPVIRERLEALAGTIAVEPRLIVWEFPSFEDMAAFFQRTAPRVANEVPRDKLPEMVAGVREVVDRWNRAEGGAVRIEAEYSQVVARKRG